MANLNEGINMGMGPTLLSRVANAQAGSTGGSSGQVGNTSYAQVSPMNDPTFAALFRDTQGAIPTSTKGIEDIVANGMNSPLLQLVLGPALQRLQAPQAQQRQNLTEQTRAAGGLRGSTYGQDQNTLANNQALQTNDLMAQVIQQVLGQLIGGQLQSDQNSFLPANSLTNLLRTIAPQTVTGNNNASTSSSSSGWGAIPPSQGLATPMQGDKDNFWNPKPTSNYSNTTIGPNAPGMNGNPALSLPPKPYTPYLDPLTSMGGGGSYDLGFGAGTQYLNSPAVPPLPGANGESVYGDWQNVPSVTEGWY